MATIAERINKAKQDNGKANGNKTSTLSVEERIKMAKQDSGKAGARGTQGVSGTPGAKNTSQTTLTTARNATTSVRDRMERVRALYEPQRPTSVFDDGYDFGDVSNMVMTALTTSRNFDERGWKESLRKYGNEYYDNAVKAKGEIEKLSAAYKSGTLDAEAYKKAYEPLANTIDEYNAFFDLYGEEYGTPRDANLVDATWNSLKRGYYQSRLGEEWHKKMNGQENEVDKYEQILSGDDYQFEADDIIDKAVSGAAEFFGQQGRQWTNPRSLDLGGTAATGAFIAGQVGPQVLAPEEIITVPAAFFGGIATGSALQNYEIESGLAYKEMTEMGISEDTARVIATAVGTGNAALELLQIDELVKGLKVLGGKQTTKGAFNTVLDVLKKRAPNVFNQVVQEDLQELTTITGTQIGSYIDKGEWAYSPGEVHDRMIDTTISSALSFGLTDIPGAARNISSQIKQNNNLGKIGAEYRAADPAVVDLLVEEGLASPPNSESHKVAQEVKAWQTAGEAISDVDVGRLVVANNRAIRVEEQLGWNDTTSAEQKTAASGVETAVNENGLTALTEQEKTNLSSGKKNKVISTFSEAVSFIKNALSNKQSVDRAYLGKVPDGVAERVLEETGVDITGYNAILPSDAVRHMFKNHGNEAAEMARGQVALTAETAANITTVLSNPDKVYLSDKTDVRGLSTLMFEKRIGDYYITAQAVSDGTHSIQTDTLYVQKKKNPQDTVSDVSVSTAPVHNARSVPPQGSSTNNTIPQPANSVNFGTEVAFGEKGMQVVAEIAADNGLTVEQAQGVVRLAYQTGRANLPGNQLDLTDANQQRAYNAGQMDYIAENSKGKDRAVQVAQDAGLVRDKMLEKANLSSKDRRMLDAVGKAVGVKVRFVDKLTDKDGRPANAQYGNGELLIALNAADPVRVAFTHEIVHRMREVSPEAYNALATFVQRNMSSDSMAVVQRAYSAAYGTNPDVLNEEIVAQAVGQMMSDSAVMERFVKDNRNAGQKLLDAVHDLVAAIKRVLNGQNVKLTAEQKADFAELQGRVEEMAKTLENALKQMETDVQRNTGAGNKNTASVGGEVKYSLNRRFAAELDAWDGKKNTVFRIGTTSKALQSIGVQDRGIIWHGKKIAEILRKHPNMSKEIIKQVPQILENPVIVMKSQQSDSRVVVFGELKDDNGDPVTAVLELAPTNKGGELLDMNVVVSAYGKDTNPAGFIQNSELLYLDKNRTESWMNAVGLQLPSVAPALGPIGTITYQDGKVKIVGVPYKQYMTNAANNALQGDSKNSLVVARSKAAETLRQELASIREEGMRTGKDAAEIEYEVQQAIERSYESLVDEYGAIPAGENPARDVQVPKRTTDNQKVSQTVRTILEAKDSLELDKSKLERVAEQYKKALDKVRADRDAKLKKLKAEHRAKEAVGRERRKARELRQKIERHASELSRKLLRPNDKKHIPQALQGPVARLLEAVNLESQYTIDPENGKRQKTPEGLPNKRTKAFTELKAAYAEIKGELVIDPDLLGEDGAVGLLDEVLAMADTPIAAMNSEQLTTMWKAIRAVEASITSTNKLFKVSRFKTVGELAQVLQEDNKGKSAKAEYNYIGGLQKLTGLDMMTPETFLHRLGSAGDTIFRMMRNAQDEHIRIMKETADFTREALAGINVRKLERELHTVTLGGEEVTLSTAQLMELYALMRREQAQNHIYKGGILPDAVSGKGLKKNIRTEAVQSISEQEVLDALELLTDEQMELAEKLQDYASNTLSGHGNKASMAVYNYEKFNEEHYWPIRSNRRETHSDVQKDTQVTTVANRGFTKAVKPNANTSVCVGSIFDTFASHASEMATYAAWLEVTEDINRVRNFVFRDKAGNRTGSVKGIIDRVHGSKGSDYLSKLLGDIANGVKSTHGQTEYMGRIVGNYKAAAVGANLRVVIQQPTAILRALDMIDPKYLVMGMKPGDGWKKALKYAPIAQWKDWGYFDINTGRQMKDVLFDSASGWEKARQGAMWLAGKMDSLAWGQLWNACETEVREQQGKPAGPTWEELTAKDPIKVVELDENAEGLSYAQLKARARNRAEREGWFERPHQNRDTGTAVFVSKDTYNHAFSNLTAAFGEDTILAMEHLPEIIERAVLTHTEGPKDPTKSETQVYTLFAAVRGKNGVEPVKLKVKEYDSDTIGTMPENVRAWFAQNKKQPAYHQLYDAKVLEVVSIERETDASASVYAPEGTQAKGTPVSEISVADLLDLVNGDARKYIPEPGADTEPFYRAVAERFTQIIDHTQVVDGILQRSQIMRDPSALAKMATSFMGEPTKQYNMMMYAVYDARNGSKEQRSAGRKRLARTVFALAAAGLVNAAAQSIMDAVRDDDDEKEYWEKWMEAFGKNAANMANPAQYVPYVKDVVSVVQGYDVSRMDMESIEKTFGAAKNFIKALGGEGKYSVPGASANLFAEGARLLGIPVANFKRDVISFAKLWAVETDSYLMQYHMQKGALNLNYYDNSGEFMDILYNAYANDREAYEIIYADMVKNGYDAGKIKSGMETRMKKAQGVESVEDLKERYLTPEQSKRYERGKRKLTGSALWKKATAQQRKVTEDDLYEMIAGTDNGERLKEKVSGGAAYGLNETEYLLYRLALSIADEPNDSGGMGTYTNAEVERAIDMVSGLSDAERSYLWLAQGKRPTSNPYD